MPEVVRFLDISQCDSRETIRECVTETFLSEVAGTGNGVLTSKYRYNVYQLSDNRFVYLSRPAHLNKGFDFTVCVDDERFPSKPRSNGRILFSNKPSHYFIIEDLKIKKNENIEGYGRLLQIIRKIYEIQPVEDNEIPSFNDGCDVSLLLVIIKWLFIEQDITYWNYSGRKMLMNSINEIGE